MIRPTLRKYRVEVAYRFKKRKDGVMLGMTVEAENEEQAIELGTDHAMKGYRNRVWLQTTAEAQS